MKFYNDTFTNVKKESQFMSRQLTEHEEKFKEYTGLNFNDYYNKYKPKLVWHLFKYTKDQERAEDFAHDALIQGLEKIESYKEEKAQFQTWLTKIARNLVIREFNENARMPFVSIDKELNNESSLSDYISYDDSNQFEREEMRINERKADIIRSVIEKLPEKYKKVMIMREIDKMRYKEIADAIIKEDDIKIENDIIKLSRVEDFFEVTIENKGNQIIRMIIENGESTKRMVRNILPEECVTVHRDDITWIRSMDDLYQIDCQESSAFVHYKTTTNLSTIKSQIKKGRNLVVKKVKKSFDLLNEQGL